MKPTRRAASRSASTRAAPARARREATTATKRSKRSPCPIVGIGASAGGLEAFTRLLSALPADTGLAYVLVQHLDPKHESELRNLLARTTAMPVLDAQHGVRVQPDRIYVIRPGTMLSVKDCVLVTKKRVASQAGRRTIDYFFESLALDLHERAIGVVLSGTDADGTVGLQTIKAEGGITFAQDESAKYDSMPRNAVATGAVDFVLPPEGISDELARIAKHPFVTGPREAMLVEAERAAELTENPDAPLASGGSGSPPTGATKARAEASSARSKPADADYRRILLLLRQHAGVDFSLYKSSTIQRRIQRRMVLGKLDSPDEYATMLKGNSEELTALYSDLLISVTSFFRNPEAFDVVKRRVIPKLLQRREHSDAVRIWVLGCSTGQEAYSLAMAFAEATENLTRAPKIQVFATDLNELMLERARHGLYAKTLVQDLSPERLRRFFVEEESGYRIVKSIREQVIFARQDAVRDPPFSRIDLISCRNFLIYLEAELQKKLVVGFHYALRPNGFLFLGLSESIGSFSELFETIDKKHKVFAKKPVQTPNLRLAVDAEARSSLSKPPQPKPAPPRVREALAEAMQGQLTALREADRLTIHEFAPPGVLVDADGQVIQFRGPTGAYLEPPKGKATFDLLKMARPGLMLPLRAALNKARREHKPVRKEGVRVQQERGTRTVTLQVIPLRNTKERSFLVLFETPIQGRIQPPESPPKRALSKRAEAARIAELERELGETRDYLQAMQEQSETAHEELQASNEEVQSANEELQSINEELETSKEELESTNEELTTVNDEMTSRNLELGRLNADLNNLQVSLRTAIVLFGRDLTVRRFTPWAAKVFNFAGNDVGRSLRGIRHNLEFPNLEPLLADVIATISVREREVQDKDGNWFLLRACPYMTLDNKVDGAVLLLIDIDALKRAELLIAEARDYAEAILRSERDPLLILRPDLTVNTANAAFHRAFETSNDEIVARSVFEIGDGAWDLPELRRLLVDVIPHESAFKDLEVVRELPGRGERVLLLNARRLDSKDGDPQYVLLGFEDVTERRSAEEALRRSAQERKELLESEAAARGAAERANRVKDDFIATLSHELRTPLNAILGWAQVLRRDGTSDETFEAGLEVIERNARDQAQLISDLLDMSRMISGKLRLQLAPVHVDAMIESALASLAPVLEEKRLEIDSACGSGATVLGDKVRLQQVVWNLVSNAAKFTPVGGHVSVACERRDDTVQIRVADDGQGIKPEFVPHLFQRFSQQDASTSRQARGLGLGLSIVKELVVLHGGSVRAESEGEGRGSTFTVTLPLHTPGRGSPAGSDEDTCDGPAETPAGPEALEDLRVLVVDDEPDTLNLFRRILRSHGAEVATASSVERALEEVERFRPDVVVSDIGMPGMDGYELARHLAEGAERSGKRIPAIAVTAYARAEDKERVLRSGFRAHLVKPVQAHELVASVARFLPRRARPKHVSHGDAGA